MYHVYLLKSLKDNRYYIGYTNNLERRLQDHDRGKSKAIKFRGPFRLAYSAEFATRTEAVRREIQIKSYKGGEAFKKLLADKDSTPSSSLV